MRKIYLLFFLFALGLAACGGPATPSTSLKVDMTDFAFSPKEFTVPAGQEITLELSNHGAMKHQLMIFNLGEQVPMPFSESDKEKVYWETELDTGKSDTLTFTAPSEPGEYQVGCVIPGHAEAGMTAKLIVVKP